MSFDRLNEISEGMVMVNLEASQTELLTQESEKKQMRLPASKREIESYDSSTKRISDWVNSHREIIIVDYNLGYDSDGELQTVVVKWE